MKPRRHAFVCTNLRASGADMPSCGGNVGDSVLALLLAARAARGLYRELYITETRCLGVCPQAGATIVVYPEGTWYVGVLPEDVPELFDEHLVGGRPLARLVDPGFV